MPHKGEYISGVGTPGATCCRALPIPQRQPEAAVSAAGSKSSSYVNGATFYL